MSNINLSIFHFSCEDTRFEEVYQYLITRPELEEDESEKMFFILRDKRELSKYLKVLSQELKHVQFIHTYAFPLSDNTGYSIFQCGNIIFQHVESLEARLTKVSIQNIKLKTNHVLITFKYLHHENTFDFDASPIQKIFTASISKKDFHKLKNEKINLLESILNFNETQISNQNVDKLVRQKAIKIVNKKELLIYIHFQDLEKKLALNKNNEAIQKI